MEKKEPFPSSFFIRRVSPPCQYRLLRALREWTRNLRTCFDACRLFICKREREREKNLDLWAKTKENIELESTRMDSYIYLYLYISFFLLLSPPLFIREIYDAFWSDRPFNRTVPPVWKVQTDALHTFSFFPSSWLFIRIHSF